MHIFSKKEAINTGWELMKKHLGFAVIVYAVYFGITFGIGFLENGIENGVLSFNIMIISYLLSFLLVIGLIKIFLKLYDGETAEISELFTNYDRYFNYLACSGLVALITIGGLILFIVPGIVWGLKYQYAPYLVIDKNMKPMEAIRKSGKITYGHKMNLFLFWFVSLGVVILGFLCCCIGIIPAGIVLSFAVIHIYRKLLNDYDNEHKVNTDSPISEDGPVCDSIPSLESVAQNPSGQAKAEEPKTPDNLGL